MQGLGFAAWLRRRRLERNPKSCVVTAPERAAAKRDRDVANRELDVAKWNPSFFRASRSRSGTNRKRSKRRKTGSLRDNWGAELQKMSSLGNGFRTFRVAGMVAYEAIIVYPFGHVG